MATDNDNELPQTQSQSNNLDETFSQLDDNTPNAWGRLVNKLKKMRTVDLYTEVFTVGRSAKCNYDLDNGGSLKEKHLVQISKNHFKITRDLSAPDNPAYIEDTSRNGTFVNEQRIGSEKKRILATGDVIAVAHPKLQIFQFQDFRYTPTTDLPSEITKKFYLQKKLGSGACGTVYLVHEFRTCGVYALKHIKKNQMMKCDGDKSLNEARIMQRLTHPCIVKMYDIFNRPESVFIKLEFMRGGELLTRIQKKKFLSEANSKLFFYQMCDAIKYLHDQKITHRDLKPDNILLASSDENTLLKISDFGLSKLVRNNSVLRTLCGTPLYVAPEVLQTNGKGEYTQKVDIWSLGVVLFTMLSGTLPFADDYGAPVADQIKRGNFQFRSHNWAKVSSTAKELIRHLLTTDAARRPSIHELLRKEWLDYSTISLAHTIMKIPLPQHYEMRGTRMALNVPQCAADSTTFALPYEVNVVNENVQPSKRRRLR